VSGCGGTWTGNPYVTGPITDDCTVTATFAIDAHTVTPSVVGSGSIDPSTPQTVNHGSTTSFTVTPSTNYHTESVSGCGGTWTGNPYVTGPITDDCTVTATFAAFTAVTLLAPNSGEILPSGSNYTIRWEAPPEAVKFKLKLSVDNGLTWAPITTDFVSGIEHFWTVPKPWGNKRKCFIKVVGYNASNTKLGIDASDESFAIEVVKLESPNGGVGVTYPSGVPLTITWTTNATKKSVAKVKLYYTKNGGLTWLPIATLKDSVSITPGLHSYNDWIPTVGEDKNNCKVKVVLMDAAGNVLGQDASDNYFTIQH
jgi:hypothetical protein